MRNIPYGYCQCGCGNKSPIAPRTITQYGWVKGEPLQYIKYHYRNITPERFWAKVNVSDADSCWNWLGFCGKAGYGTITIQKRSQLVHRVAWQLVNGEIPKGLVVMHKCDNPSCVNPNHLAIGTQKANILDMHQKGRAGQNKHDHQKLTHALVEEIRSRYESGEMTQPDLAKIYGVSSSHISNIIRMKRWLD